MTQQQATFSPSAAVLWASALIIAALIIIQAGKLPPNAAHAEMASAHSDYAALTCPSGLGGDLDPEELLFVIDNRGEVVLIYEIEDARKKQIVLRGGGSLSNLFRNATGR